MTKVTTPLLYEKGPVIFEFYEENNKNKVTYPDGSFILFKYSYTKNAFHGVFYWKNKKRAFFEISVGIDVVTLKLNNELIATYKEKQLSSKQVDYDFPQNFICRYNALLHVFDFCMYNDKWKVY